MALISKKKILDDLQAFFPTVDGIQPETLLAQIRTDIENAPAELTAQEIALLRKVLQCVNQLYTVAEPEFRENKIDILLRKLREMEQYNA